MVLRAARLGLYYPITTYEQRWKKGENCFELYVEEAFRHAGLTVEHVRPDHIPTTNVDILIIPNATNIQLDEVDTLLAFVESGGMIVQFNGGGLIGKRFGLHTVRQLSVGYASLPEDDSNEPIRFLKAESLKQVSIEGKGPSVTWSASGNLSLTPNGHPIGSLWYEVSIGNGMIVVCSVDVFTTVVLLQQGSQPVTEDGLPAYDGSAALDDGILKAEDTLQLDWEWDRSETPASNSKFFGTPYSDLWRDTVIRKILTTALKVEKTFPVLGYWPAGIKAVAHLSHDSDLNIDESAKTTLDLLNELNINSTWCMIEPGYSQEVYKRIKEDGHELAFHYNALEKDGGNWKETEFHRQFNWLTDAIGCTEVISNKNHYTRFEGWGELFSWCEKCGIQLDQTRGSSKGGNRGFVFSTCHPYRPIAWHDEKNRFYDVLENGFFTQDLDLSDQWGKSDIIYPLLDQTERVEGVAHFLFHQVHIHRSEDVRNALRKLVKEAKRRGLPWWTSKQINAWERGRRSVNLELTESFLRDGHLLVQSDVFLNQAVFYIPLGNAASHLIDAKNQYVVDRFGIPCIEIVSDIVPGMNTLKFPKKGGVSVDD